MTKAFIKLIRESDLMNTDPNAFLILSTVARFMGRDGEPARITWRHFPTMTEKAYRAAKARLTRGGQAAFKGRTRWTDASLLTRDVYDINETGADKGRTDGTLGATKQEVRTKNKEKDKARPIDLQAVHEYMVERGQLDFSEAQAFWDYWESAGWRRRSGPIKDWKATVRTWLKNNFGGKANDKQSSRESTKSELRGGGGGVVIQHDRSVSQLQNREPGRHQEHLGGAPLGILARSDPKGGKPDD